MPGAWTSPRGPDAFLHLAAVLGGPAPFGEAEKRRLANALDRILTKARLNPS